MKRDRTQGCRYALRFFSLSSMGSTRGDQRRHSLDHPSRRDDKNSVSTRDNGSRVCHPNHRHHTRGGHAIDVSSCHDLCRHRLFLSSPHQSGSLTAIHAERVMPMRPNRLLVTLLLRRESA
jgi:hypothetical protein